SASITAKTQDGNFSSSSSISVTLESQPLSIKSFALVNAGTNNNIQFISDGDQLDYNQFRDMSLNFRTITYPEIIGSVAITLSGPVNSSRTDNGATYDLLNNNGLQLPAGEYTLTSVPYSERDKGGSKGAALSIKFSIMDVNKVEIPSSPTPISPENGSNGVISAVNLQWSPTEGSETYDIQVSEDMDFKIKHVDLDNISTNNTEIDNLNAAKTYYWRVKASNSSGSSTFSEPWSFLTNAPEPVNIAVTGVKVTPESISLEAGASSQISASVFPSDASNTKLVWSSSDATVAAIDEKGTVTALESGKATLTAKTEDGGFIAQSTVTVMAKSGQLSVNSFSLVDAASNTVIADIEDGDQLDYNQFGDMSLNFRTITYPEKIGSVVISLAGPVNSSRTDNGFTYDLLNNKGLRLPAGEY
ncbi:MAG: Ig-like domain-containing protein, partial [Cyclobacteriaceae bacterium]